MIASERERKEARRQIETEASVETNLLTWLAIHGNLCLALRHPQNKGASRPLVMKFVKELGDKLLEWKVITEEQLAAAQCLEQEESPHGF